MSGHTPLPWRIKTPAHATIEGEKIHSYDDGWTKYYGNVANICDGKDREANAAFIVRACNSHYDLLEALERAMPYLEDAANDCRDTPNEAAHILDAMKRACAKAKGEV